MDSAADDIIARVLGRYLSKEGSVHVGMARGFVVVDENVAFLEHPLEQANFHVDTPEKGLDDAKIKKRMLGKRVLVTRNTQDFLADAPVLPSGFNMSTRQSPLIPRRLISEAYSKFKLHSKRTGYHVFRRLG